MGLGLTLAVLLINMYFAVVYIGEIPIHNVALYMFLAVLLLLYLAFIFYLVSKETDVLSFCGAASHPVLLRVNRVRAVLFIVLFVEGGIGRFERDTESQYTARCFEGGLHTK